jgi:opacity protein-like surface antigen
MKTFSKVAVTFAALLISVSQASAQEAAPAPSLDTGWDKTGGLIFGLQNIFQESGILEGYRGFGIGGQYNLDPTMALRLGLQLSHHSDPAYKVTQTSTVGDVTETNETMTNTDGPTSTSSFGVGVDFLKRISTSAVSPYVGGGLTMPWSRMAQEYTDDVMVENQTTTVDNKINGFTLGLQGIVGIGWRVHPNFSLFAEYALGLNLLDKSSTTGSTEIKTEDMTAVTKTEGSETSWFNLDLGLAQGASLGVIAFF